MDRVMVYDGALPQTTDILNAGKFALVSDAYQNRAILGTSTVVNGLACAPTVPASLQVTVGVGSIYTLDPTDAAAYADLGIDNNSIMKQGILDAAVNLTVTPPGTVGFSQVFLVQVILNNVDSGQMVLSYYNSSNPAAPYSGPSNSGSSNYTTRLCKAVVALKAGTPATTGTQITPAPDAGYVGLYTITVANGATSVTGGNIVQLPSAPFFPTLPGVPAGVLNSSWVYVGTDTGTANAYAIAFGANQAIPTAYVAGMTVKFKALNANTTASVINVNALGNVPIKRATGAALSASDIASGQIVELTYDGTNFQMVNYLGVSAGSTTNNFTSVGVPYIADTGALNALIGTYSPAITGGQVVAGLMLSIKLANTITGACTINVSGLGLKNIKTGDLANPPPNVYLAGEVLLLVYDGTQYQIVNTSSLTYRKPVANTTIFVNGSTGDDALYDGTSASVGAGTSGPLKTMQKAITTAFGYAPSQYTITISVAPGVYNEALATPSYAGPNLVIDGNIAASVVINSSGASCLSVRGPNTVQLTRCTYQSTGSPSVAHGVVADAGSQVSVSNCISNAVAGTVFLANNGGVISPSLHLFNGSCQYLFAGLVNGIVKMSGVYTIGTAINASGAVCAASQGGQVDTGFTAGSCSFTNGGFVSGLKYSVALNGVVNATSVGGAAALPGSGGSQSLGGQIL
jgi:hypothetical protein